MGSGVPGRLGSLGPDEPAGPGVSANLLMAGIWGVIERGGEPGARMGLHEQLNVIRLRPSGSSWVIDNPAAFLPGSRLQTGGWLREGREGPLPVFCPSGLESWPLPAPRSVRGCLARCSPRESAAPSHPALSEPLRTSRHQLAPSCWDRRKTGSKNKKRGWGWY